MTMDRRNYETIARIIRANRVLVSVDVHAIDVVDELARDLAQAFYSDNEHFDREQFLAACEVPSRTENRR